jgi:EAL and modified HD-GYP domain-containing signal transduction protein
VHSIREALLLLGRDTVRRWASLWALADLGADAHAELVAMATVRARLCELVAVRTRGDEAASEAFLLGMCSLLDAVLGKPLSAIAEELPLSEETRAALRGEPVPARDILDCAVAYERGAWKDCQAIAARAGVNPLTLPAAYFEALRWSRELQTPAPVASRVS